MAASRRSRAILRPQRPRDTRGLPFLASPSDPRRSVPKLYVKAGHRVFISFEARELSGPGEIRPLLRDRCSNIPVALRLSVFHCRTVAAFPPSGLPSPIAARGSAGEGTSHLVRKRVWLLQVRNYCLMNSPCSQLCKFIVLFFVEIKFPR